MRDNDSTGDEIWLIEPSGRNNRRIWSAGFPDPEADIYRITDLDWRPDAGEIAFASQHERECSIFDSDLYAIRPDGSNYRRVTNGPNCAALAKRPKGTVTVPVQNVTTRSPLFIYLQGAPAVKSVVIPPGRTVNVTFTNVADLGTGVPQQAVAIWGLDRWMTPIAQVDVKAGQTVRTGRLDVGGYGVQEYGAYIPSWRQDGSRVGYILVAAGSMYQVPSTAAPPSLLSGQPVLKLPAGTIERAIIMDWGPTRALANQVLYGSYLAGGIFRVSEGARTPGTKLVSTTNTEQVVDLQWLPDGSGFVFSKSNILSFSNVYRYDFASRRVTQLTRFDDTFVVDISVSPDGEWMVIERSTTPKFTAGDLWLMRKDGSDLQLLVKNGMRPSWSPRPLP